METKQGKAVFITFTTDTLVSSNIFCLFRYFREPKIPSTANVLLVAWQVWTLCYNYIYIICFIWFWLSKVIYTYFSLDWFHGNNKKNRHILQCRLLSLLCGFVILSQQFIRLMEIKIKQKCLWCVFAIRKYTIILFGFFLTGVFPNVISVDKHYLLRGFTNLLLLPEMSVR